MYYLGFLGCLLGVTVLGLTCTLPPSLSSFPFFLSLRPSSVAVVWARAWVVCLSGCLRLCACPAACPSCLSAVSLPSRVVCGRSLLFAFLFVVPGFRSSLRLARSVVRVSLPSLRFCGLFSRGVACRSF